MFFKRKKPSPSKITDILRHIWQNALAQANQNVMAICTNHADAVNTPANMHMPADIIEAIDIFDQTILVVLHVDPDLGTVLEDFRLYTQNQLAQHFPKYMVQIVLTGEKAAPKSTASPVNDSVQNPSSHIQEKPAAKKQAQPLPEADLPAAKHIIAVASGKGGVGKSTISYNLAASLMRVGYRVGVLDADIYGPSIPRMAGLVGQKPESIAGEGQKDKASQDKTKIKPLSVKIDGCDMAVMSIGFMIEEDAPLIWRGPMVQSALIQLMRDVDWASYGGALDYLIIDMPPGTGDVQLTLAQKVPLTGAVIVSTPQDIALIDARKAIAMFQKMEVPILGLVENMSLFQCPNCGETHHIFHHGGARDEAAKQQIPFLGEIPLRLDIRQDSDQGLAVRDGDVFMDCAKKIANSSQ